MTALQITSMKQFMSQFLAGDAFDVFLLEEAVISAANTTTIDGHLNREFFSEEDLLSGQVPDYDFMPWSNLKGLCFHLMKGKRTPLSFKFILLLKPELAEKLLSREDSDFDPSQISALVLTVRYDKGRAVLTTGVSMRTFLLSKEPDRIWDRALSSYLAQKGISAEPL